METRGKPGPSDHVIGPPVQIGEGGCLEKPWGCRGRDLRLAHSSSCPAILTLSRKSIF